MGAYSYCTRCDAPQESPKPQEFVYGKPTCASCGAERFHSTESDFRECLVAELTEQGERILALETAVQELMNKHKDDGK
jgi:hypothetical protein